MQLSTWLTFTKKISLYSSKKKTSHNNVRDVPDAGLTLLANHYKKDSFYIRYTLIVSLI